jgi:probable F420-dependent oxidoreductase
MRIGVVFPQTEFGNDLAALRDYAQTVEGLGYSHILAYDHVLGANPDRPGGWSGPYTFQTPFHEVFVLFSFMAAVTQRIELTTGILILPQRQTSLVAKQAASLDVLSGGRLRLGVGIGWNDVEYLALNENFHNRGRRIEEQIELLRLLWTQPLVQFGGRWHTIPDAGLNPMPVQQPIPVWFGGHAEAVLQRMARLGDGWMTNYRTSQDARPSLDKLDEYLSAVGRNRAGFGIEARLTYGDGNPARLLALTSDWQQAGASHLSVNTMGADFQEPGEHLQALANFAREMGLK